jgi:hypothetical protein
MMRMNCFVPLLSLALLLPPAGAQTTWLVNSTNQVGGHAVTVRGCPQIVRTPHGDAVWFNGINDGLIVSNNPLAGLTNFTVELIFKQNALTVPTAREPRIVHVQSANPPDHRLTLETRISTNTAPHTFYLDTFLRFGDADQRHTLLNERHPHPVGEWTHVAVTYDGTNFCNYFDGRLELCGTVRGTPFTGSGSTWIGQRANNKNYFEGAVLALRFTPRALGTNEFMGMPVPGK